MSGQEASPPTLAARLLGWVRLLRLSNAPTAIADVWAGFAVVSGELTPTPALVLATVASLGFYHGGMALNDANDAERDAVDRRERPIPQGLVRRRDAYGVWCALAGVGVAASIAVSWLLGEPQCVLVAATLGFCVRGYNVSAVKRSALGPIVMGACRLANVSLGVAAAGSSEAVPMLRAWQGVSAGVLLYVAGVTVFARDEANASKRDGLALGLAVASIGLAWFAFAPIALQPAGVAAGTGGWWMLWVATATFALRGMVAALLQPTPARIGRGVGIAIQGIIVIDATLATLYAGPAAGLAILALLPVTMLLSLWVPQT